MLKVMNINTGRIVKCRENLFLSVNYVATVLDISLEQLLRIENGIDIPTEDILEKMAKIYGCAKEYFTEELQDRSDVILARNGKDISEHDEMQILELMAFREKMSELSRIESD